MRRYHSSTQEEAGEEGEGLPAAAVVGREWGDAVAEASRRRSKKATSAHLLEGPHETDEMQKQKHRGGKQRQHETDKNDDTSFSISIREQRKNSCCPVTKCKKQRACLLIIHHTRHLMLFYFPIVNLNYFLVNCLSKCASDSSICL